MSRILDPGRGVSSLAIAIATFGMMTASCAVDEQIDSTLPDLTFEEFEATVYQEPDTGVYIVDGDVPLETREQLRDFYDAVYVRGELIVNTVGGDDDCWDDAQKVAITYCVSQSSFGGNYSRVVQAMDSATSAWESAANVDFVHVSSKDGNCSAKTSGVVFDVRQTSTTQYLARAFFPSTSRRNSNVLISVTVYPYDDDNSDPLSLAGVLRHELGHALGFRHEHTRPESGACYEDSSWRELTTYDSDSVMHYPQCNGTGDWSLTLTSRDKAGAADLYGTGSGSGSCSAGGGGGGGQCTANGDSCSSDSDCCSGSCSNGPPSSRVCQ